MSLEHGKYYYALVWGEALKDKNLVIKGSPLVKGIKLSEDPRMLYGTSDKDKFKVRIESYKEIKEYDVFSTKQSVRFVKEVEEVLVTRDVRIVIWQHKDTMCPKYDHYRVVSKQYFEELAEHSLDSFDAIIFEEKVSEESIWKANVNPEKLLKKKIAEKFGLNLEFA